ncbi:MAG: phytanoyl-CoA dioxygenase family protein [Bacteroidota bacterium]
MIKPIFKNPDHQEKFDRQGFIVLPFLSEEEVGQLDKAFDQLHPELPDSGFISGSYSGDFQYKKKASDLIKDAFSPQYERLFTNYRALGGAFLFKVPSENSDLILHQDWTIVDEEKFVALNVWVPLTDIHKTNGALMVLPGSHYPKLPVLRAPTLNFFFTGNEKVLMDELKPQYVKAGHAVILNQSVVHYSPANTSGKVRKAITAGVVTDEAPLQFYYFDQAANKPEVEQFAQEDDFLIRFDNFFQDIFQRPKLGDSLGKKPYQLPSFEEKELRKIVSTMVSNAGFKPKAQPGLFDRLRSLFRS